MKKVIFLLAVLIISLSGVAQAVQTIITDYLDTPRQDPLWVPPLVHELGSNQLFPPFFIPAPVPFPPDEEIFSFDIQTLDISCQENWDPGGPPNFLVSITNLTKTAWTDLWYVADPETLITNDDGIINGGLAFKIDKVGVNTPLVFESMNQDSIFEPGEQWAFIIQNYFNFMQLPASAFDSVGVGKYSLPGPNSSGSIIAIPVPGAILLGGIGIGLVGWLRRRRTL